MYSSEALSRIRVARFLDRSGFILFMGLELVLVYSQYYGTSHMQHFCNSWRVWNLLVMVLKLNKPLKLAESIISFHNRLLMPSTTSLPFLYCILRSSHVVGNAREYPFT